ncbi:MAG: hypothetical protein OK442_07870 [Thaumarchaeota archaeon]|nr:hypothetical protein [Nitrososphaerota archaeon]
MSFGGGGTGRTRSGSKGFSSKEKKQKRKKQEYHVHKRGHFQETERPDAEEVRKRTILTLERLGHQVLSSEPGGYDLEAWMRNINALLDDFGEKVGDGVVGEEFRARSQHALSGLTASSSATEIDLEIEKVTQEEAAARAAAGEAEKAASARLASLREERDACIKELKEEREKLSELKARQSRQLFSRLLRSGPSTADAEKSVAELESKLEGLEHEIESRRRTRSDPAYIEAEKRFETARSRLLELQSSRQGLLQLAREREAATQALSGMISSLKLGEGAPSGADARGG